MSTADGGLSLDALVTTNGAPNGSGHLLRRGFRDDIDYPPHRVIAVEDAARSSHDFDPLDLIQGNLGPIDPTQIDLIDTTPIHHHQGVKRSRFSKSTHVNLRILPVTKEIPHDNPLFGSEQIRHVFCVRVLDVFLGDHRHVGRDFSNLLLLSCRRYHHLLKDGDSPFLSLLSQDHTWRECHRQYNSSRPQTDEQPLPFNLSFSVFFASSGQSMR